MWPRPQYVTGLNRDAFSEPFFTDRSAMRGHDTPTMDAVAARFPRQEAQLETCYDGSMISFRTVANLLRANFRITPISRSINASGG